jgi:hypothetical protein
MVDVLEFSETLARGYRTPGDGLAGQIAEQSNLTVLSEMLSKAALAGRVVCGRAVGKLTPSHAPAVLGPPLPSKSASR